jgi:adenylate kinase
MYKVIYLTGAPAAGKSTAARWLSQNVPEVELFQYGNELTKLANAKNASSITQEQVRAKSSSIITKEHVRELDQYLIEFVSANRHRSHVIVDSHAVTKESFGFRITPFSVAQIVSLAPTEIWVLYANARETIRRIKADPEGRQSPTTWEADFNTELQSSVAAIYGVLAPAPVYLFDTRVSQVKLRNSLRRRLS